MAKKRVSETFWKAIAPLLPEHEPSPKGGRPPVPDRACLEGIIFVLKTGMPWQMLPTRLGYGSGSTCWRRFRDWTRLGVWPELHRQWQHLLAPLPRLDAAGGLARVAPAVAARPGPPRPDQLG